MGDWGALRKDLLELICERLTQLSDCHRFGSVCVAWRSVAVDCLPRLLPKYFPKLVIPGDSKDSKTIRCIQPSIGHDGYFKFEKIADENHPKLLPIPGNYYCCGSSLGWLVLVDDSSNMQLFNPLSGVKFELPSSTTLPSQYYGNKVHKAVISQDPMSYSTSADTIVFVLIIYAGQRLRLALCKLGDQLWTPIQSYGYYDDVIYYNLNFYALDHSSKCDVVDFYGSGLFTIRPHVKHRFDHHERSYLVESEGELFSVQMIISFASPQDEGNDNSSDDEEVDKDDQNPQSDGDDVSDDEEVDEGDPNPQSNDDEVSDDENDQNPQSDDNDVSDNEEVDEDDQNPQNDDDDDDAPDDNEDISEGGKDYYRTVSFRVHKLEESYWKWEEVEDIGDCAFFVGFNTSFSLHASHYMGCCKPNSIYFTDDMHPYREGEEPEVHDIGVFNLKDRSFHSIFRVDSSSTRQPSFWFTPNGPY